MSLRRVAIACALGLGVSAGGVGGVTLAQDVGQQGPARPAADLSRGASGPANVNLRAELALERRVAHRALSIRTVQVRALRRRLRALLWMPSSPVSHLIDVEAAVHGVNARTLKSVAWRESSLERPGMPQTGPGSSATAVNPVALAGEPAGACGVLQFIPSTWSKTAAAQAGYSCTDWMANVIQAVDWWARGMAGNWSPLPGPVRG